MAADLYAVLGVSKSATVSEIKEAYRLRSLDTPPERLQAVKDAYFILSDSGRRRDYDRKRSSRGGIFSVAGGAAGAVLGYIFANVPGAVVGAAGGFWLGSIRDTAGKPVAEVFQELPHAEKAKHVGGLAGFATQYFSGGGKK